MGKGRRLRALRVLRARDAREAYNKRREEADEEARKQRQAESLSMETTRRIMLNSQAYRPIIVRPGNPAAIATYARQALMARQLGEGY